MLRWGRGSLRQRFLLVVIAGAIIPLALVGWWLTQSALRSGEERVRTALDSSLTSIADGIERQWVSRRGEVLLLANNEVVVRTTTTRAAATAADSAYMQRAFSAVEGTVAEFRVRAADGSNRWSFAEAASSPRDSSDRGLGVPPRRDAFVVRVPIATSGTRSAGGQLEAYVRLTSVLTPEAVQQVVGGSVLGVVDRETGTTLAPATPPRRDGWLIAQRRLSAPALDLTLSVPPAAFVRPFEHAARIGLATLAAVSGVVLLLSIFLTGRLTRALEDLQAAATAVSGGDLERRVPGGGDDEVGRLADAFNTMTDNLQRTLRDLSRQQALAAMGEYAATLSHEVRNALSAVRVDLQRAEERTHDPATMRALLGRALLNVQQLDLIVAGALRVARQGRTSLRPIDLRPVLDAAVAAGEPTFSRVGAKLSVHLGDGDLPVDGDSSALQQVFTNILVNAGQSLAAGGTAAIETVPDDGACVIVVRDTGAGISRDRMSRIGEAFYSSKSDGTGIGLAITRRIVAAHGGQLSIESELGIGTTVRVSIPRKGSGGGE